MQDLTNKVVVITGASRGIGQATALQLSEYGAKVVLAARNVDHLNATLERIHESGGSAIACATDIANFEQVQALIQTAHQQYGRIDVLVNNAGMIEPIAKLADIEPQAWATVLQVNTIGVFNTLRATLPVMLEQGRGTVINLSSGAANKPLEGWSHYCASKAAAKMLTQSVHLEYASAGIIAVGLSSGTVATDMMRSIKKSGINPVSQIDWQNHIHVNDVAQAVAYLCTDAAIQYAGTDFSLKTPEGRRAVGLV